MADGQTHYKYWKKGTKTLPIITIVVWLSTAFYYWRPIETVLVILEMSSVLYHLGRWIDPDLDQAGTSSADGRMVKEIPFFGYLFYIWWTIYALLMSAIVKVLGLSKGYLGAHRSKLTHSYVGTAIRVVWFNIPIVFLLIVFDANVNIEFARNYLIAMMLAFSYSDSRHYRLDK